METERKLRVPYATSGQVDETLELLKRMTPKRIDSSFIVDNRLATASNAFRLLDFIRFFGISDEEGNPCNEIINKLKLIGDERSKVLIDLIKKAYSDLFEGIDLTIARKEDIINFFISHYKLNNGIAKSAAALFLHLCEKYGIEISDELKKKTHLSSLTQGSRKKEKKQKEEKRIIIETPAVRDDNEISIIVKAKGVNYPFYAKNKEEFEDIVKRKLPLAIEGVRNSLKLMELEEQDNEK